MKEATDRTSGAYEPIDVFAQAMRGQVGFWFIEDEETLIAVAVVQFVQHPRSKSLEIPFIGGSRLEEWWGEFVTQMEEFARKNQCRAITSVCARPGWVRFWKSHGVDVRTAGMVVVREVT